jgi:hypothetical protein
VRFLFPEHVNHVLKHEPRPRSELVPAEVFAGYNGPGARLDPEVQAGKLTWLAEAEAATGICAALAACKPEWRPRNR